MEGGGKRGNIWERRRESNRKRELGTPPGVRGVSANREGSPS